MTFQFWMALEKTWKIQIWKKLLKPTNMHFEAKVRQVNIFSILRSIIEFLQFCRICHCSHQLLQMCISIPSIIQKHFEKSDSTSVVHFWHCRQILEHWSSSRNSTLRRKSDWRLRWWSRSLGSNGGCKPCQQIHRGLPVKKPSINDFVACVSSPSQCSGYPNSLCFKNFVDHLLPFKSLCCPSNLSTSFIPRGVSIIGDQ